MLCHNRKFKSLWYVVCSQWRCNRLLNFVAVVAKHECNVPLACRRDNVYASRFLRHNTEFVLRVIFSYFSGDTKFREPAGVLISWIFIHNNRANNTAKGWWAEVWPWHGWIILQLIQFWTKGFATLCIADATRLIWSSTKCTGISFVANNNYISLIMSSKLKYWSTNTE